MTPYIHKNTVLSCESIPAGGGSVFTLALFVRVHDPVATSLTERGGDTEARVVWGEDDVADVKPRAWQQEYAETEQLVERYCR